MKKYFIYCFLLVNINNYIININFINVFQERIEFLDMINKIDKRIGLYKRENWRDEINRKI